jgi:alpha-galactosidase
MPAGTSFPRRVPSFISPVFLLVFVFAMAFHAVAAPAEGAPQLALVPPMGWNDWAHYQCGFTAQTILANARALVKTGLAARGYNTVTIDDCWMQKDRDARGNLQIDPKRFPQGVKPVAEAVHALGLKFGIYEDAGYATCGGFAGSGDPKGGGKDHFLQDAELFASWGVDYLKLDGCNVYVPKGVSQDAAYRKAYAAQSAALKRAGRPIVFSESAPAYFQGTPAWYDVLGWVGGYGELWREGTDVATFDPKKPGQERFTSVLWNYAYNLPLGRFQKPGNWNDADFIIGGDGGMNVAETRSQLALWSMMSAPLILSSDLEKLSPQAVATLSKPAILAIDQDPLGRMATLVRRSAVMDILFKPLKGGDYAIAVLNRSTQPLPIKLAPSDFGFAANAGCGLDAQNLWSGMQQSFASALQASVAPHDTQIWRIHATAACRPPARIGVITMISGENNQDVLSIDRYSRCLAAPGRVQGCAGTTAESWTVTTDGALASGGRCLAVVDGKPAMQPCASGSAQHWNYRLSGNLVSDEHKCLTGGPKGLSVEVCGHNRPDQIWSLPN